MIAEVLQQHSGLESNETDIQESDGLLKPQDKVKMRSAAADRAFERLEPETFFIDDPAVGKLLALGDVIYSLRDQTYPQAREAAQRLDEFIRSRGLDQSIPEGEKADYFYRADQVNRIELEKLSSTDQGEFAALEDDAKSALAKLKKGFKTIDALRVDIVNERAAGAENGAKDLAQNGRYVPGEIRSRA